MKKIFTNFEILAKGLTLQTLGDLGVATTRHIIDNVLRSIARLASQFMQMPGTEK